MVTRPHQYHQSTLDRRRRSSIEDEIAFFGEAEIDDIIAFFTSKNGVTAFDWTIPDTNGSENGNTETTIKVICENWSQTWDYDNFYTASATFYRVYEA